jgi:hypothetical protein
MGVPGSGRSGPSSKDVAKAAKHDPRLQAKIRQLAGEQMKMSGMVKEFDEYVEDLVKWAEESEKARVSGSLRSVQRDLKQERVAQKMIDSGVELSQDELGAAGAIQKEIEGSLNKMSAQLQEARNVLAGSREGIIGKTANKAKYVAKKVRQIAGLRGGSAGQPGQRQAGRQRPGMPGRGQPGQRQPGQQQAGQRRPGQGQPGQGQPGQRQPGQQQAGQRQAGQGQPGQGQPGQRQPGQQQAGQRQPGQGQPGQGQPGQRQPGQQQPGQRQPGQQVASRQQSSQGGQSSGQGQPGQPSAGRPGQPGQRRSGQNWRRPGGRRDQSLAKHLAKRQQSQSSQSASSPGKPGPGSNVPGGAARSRDDIDELWYEAKDLVDTLRDQELAEGGTVEYIARKVEDPDEFRRMFDKINKAKAGKFADVVMGVGRSLDKVLEETLSAKRLQAEEQEQCPTKYRSFVNAYFESLSNAATGRRNPE